MEEMVILFVTDIVKLFMSFKIKFILWGPFLKKKSTMINFSFYFFP